jgi:hypothetical protein
LFFFSIALPPARGRKVLENRNVTDEERIGQLEKELEETIMLGEEADRKYEEVGKTQLDARVCCAFPQSLASIELKLNLTVVLVSQCRAWLDLRFGLAFE